MLDPTVFPNAATLKTNAQLARLNVSERAATRTAMATSIGSTSSARARCRFATAGPAHLGQRRNVRAALAGSGLRERGESALQQDLFNIANSTTRDNRSDDKGIEPESVVVGVVGGTRYAFVGLKRDSGIVVLDLTSPDRAGIRHLREQPEVRTGRPIPGV